MVTISLALNPPSHASHYASAAANSNCTFFDTSPPDRGDEMARITELPTLLEGFQLSCLAEGKQSTTIRWYMGKLRIFLRYLQTKELPTEFRRFINLHRR